MRIIAIIQARLSSNRLPGKVLRLASGKPLLQYLVEGLSRCRSIGRILVATSAEPTDDKIAIFCDKINVSCFRGALHDVAGRFRSLLDTHPSEAFVRANADSPLLDHRLVSRAVELFESGEYDLVTNTWPRTFPPGQSVEVVRTEAFQRIGPLITDLRDREHVTRFFYQHPEGFRIENFEALGILANIHMAIDEMRHFDVFEAVVRRMTKPHWDYPLDELAALYRSCMAESVEVHP